MAVASHNRTNSQDRPHNFRLRKADNPLSYRSRKGFGQDCCPEWFFRGFCGVSATVTRATDNLADGFYRRYRGTPPIFRGMNSQLRTMPLQWFNRSSLPIRIRNFSTFENKDLQ